MLNSFYCILDEISYLNPKKKLVIIYGLIFSRDESLLCQGLALNDDLQRVLSKHESISSGAAVQNHKLESISSGAAVQNHTEKPNPEPSGALIDVDGPLIDTGDTSKQTDAR